MTTTTRPGAQLPAPPPLLPNPPRVTVPLLAKSPPLEGTVLAVFPLGIVATPPLSLAPTRGTLRPPMIGMKYQCARLEEDVLHWSSSRRSSVTLSWQTLA